MARLWSCGFELNSTTLEGWVASGNTNPVMETGIVKSGTYSLKHNFASTFSSLAQYQFSSSEKAILFAKIGFYATANPPVKINTLLMFYSDSHGGQLYAKLETNGTLGIYYWSGSAETQIGSTSSTSITLSSWNYIELGINMSTLASTSVTLKLNGTQVCTGTINFAVVGQTGMNKLQWGASASSSTSYTCYSDDVAINDNAGSFQNSYPGDGKIIHLRPSAAGDNTQWTGTAGSGANYLRVNEVTPDDDTSHVGDNTEGNIDDYNIDNTPAAIGASDTINVVHVGARIRPDSVGSSSADVILRIKASSAGTVQESATITTPNDSVFFTNSSAIPYNYPLTLYDLPGASTTAWTKADLDTAQIGIKTVNAGIGGARVSTVWALVDYTPSTAGPTLTVDVDSTDPSKSGWVSGVRLYP